ncbi:hypothetical protein WEI85_09670 [Actinomycetes bacterium KLBMP 9797]
MSKYVITITPDNDGAAAADTAHTTVRVDTSTGQTRITELTVRAGTGGGLAPGDLPPVDLDLLVRALTAPAPAAALTAAEPTAPVAPAAPAATPAPEPDVEAEPVARRRRGRKAAAKATPAKTATARKSTAKRAQKATAGGPRAYRRMPDADEVMAVYQEAGSITGVADHFGVPRHTVAGWARRLRQMGYTIGRG